MHGQNEVQHGNKVEDSHSDVKPNPRQSKSKFGFKTATGLKWLGL